jgi:hypothetical protein
MRWKHLVVIRIWTLVPSAAVLMVTSSKILFVLWCRVLWRARDGHIFPVRLFAFSIHCSVVCDLLFEICVIFRYTILYPRLLRNKLDSPESQYCQDYNLNFYENSNNSDILILQAVVFSCSLRFLRLPLHFSFLTDDHFLGFAVSMYWSASQSTHLCIRSDIECIRMYLDIV